MAPVVLLGSALFHPKYPSFSSYVFFVFRGWVTNIAIRRLDLLLARSLHGPSTRDHVGRQRVAVGDLAHLLNFLLGRHLVHEIGPYRCAHLMQP